MQASIERSIRKYLEIVIKELERPYSIKMRLHDDNEIVVGDELKKVFFEYYKQKLGEQQ